MFQSSFFKRISTLAIVVVALGLSHFVWRAMSGQAQGPIATDNGDVNGDHRRDITDAVYLLDWLFRGGPEPVACAQGFQCDGEPLCAIPGRNLNLPKGTNLVINTTGLGSNTGLEFASVDKENRDYTWVFFTADGTNPQLPANSLDLVEYPGAGSGHPASQRFLILPSESAESVRPVVIDGVGRLIVGNQITIGNPEPDSNALLNVAGPIHTHMSQTGGFAAIMDDDTGKGIGIYLDGPSRGIVSRNTDSSLFLGTSGDNRGGGIHKDLVISESSGFVGIGTEAPQARLDVQGTLRCHVMEIQGGGDVAEPFDVEGQEAPEPGTVVVIDSDRPGKLRISSAAYDSTVAGVISGANGLSPGVTLRKPGSAADGRFPVAMTGRVWCRCDATMVPIRPGDLLTTSPTAGHAMKAVDPARTAGAVLGKAMSKLEAGKGLVLILVSLQ